jgi:hypothetical protein
LSLVLLCGLLGSIASVLAAPESATRSIQEVVPRQVQVAVGNDHVWASVRVSLRPSDLGLSSWQRWDRDDDGSLSASEQDLLAVELRDRETEFLALTVDGQALRLSTARWKWEGPPAAAHALGAAVTLRIEARTELRIEVGEHRYVLYDKPARADGIVPIRFSLASGMVLGAVSGARAEKRSPRRLEAVVSQQAPVVWGTFERPAQP